MALKEVERVRRKCVLEMDLGLRKLRQYVSCIDGNQQALEYLNSKHQSLVADFTERLMECMGHAAAVTNQDREARSHARRAVAKLT